MKFRIAGHDDRLAVKDYVDSLPEGKAYDVEITRRRAGRTIPQNRLYWLYVGCICKETGLDRETVHLYLRKKFLGTETRFIGPDMVEEVIPTSGLDALRFKQYIEGVKLWVKEELGIVLPDLKDSWFKQFEDTYGDMV